MLDEGRLHRVPGPEHLAKGRELREALARHAAAELPALVDASREDVLLDSVEDAGYRTQQLQAPPRTLVRILDA
ncbi:hypothetical protein ACFY3N_11615 [Streptomyces sp. NPDC000348]|uniref:hypothetical protein n=1 Tax=Streptomyces sp. NPDC000348 TaxID=3364538 RepID=UPI0036BC2C12